MFRDKDQELDRLSAELLAQEEDEEELLDELYDDIADTDGVYRNFSNGYGSAYNSDNTEVSPEELSDALLNKPVNNRPLVMLACLLLAAIAGVAIYWVVRFF